MADRYYHAPETSSLIEETDLVWTRPCTNIHILGLRALKAISLRHNGEQVFRGENFSKTWSLFGPHYWEYQEDQWSLSESIPVDGVSLRHEFRLMEEHGSLPSKNNNK